MRRIEREILTQRKLQVDAENAHREWEADWYRTRQDDLLGEWVKERDATR